MNYVTRQPKGSKASAWPSGLSMVATRSVLPNKSNNGAEDHDNKPRIMQQFTPIILEPPYQRRRTYQAHFHPVALRYFLGLR